MQYRNNIAHLFVIWIYSTENIGRLLVGGMGIYTQPSVHVLKLTMKSIETIWGNILLGEIKVGSSHVVNNSMVYFGALMWEFED